MCTVGRYSQDPDNVVAAATTQLLEKSYFWTTSKGPMLWMRALMGLLTTPRSRLCLRPIPACSCQLRPLTCSSPWM
eukprot:1711533-Pyramimonas_sp.AAC.1